MDIFAKKFTLKKNIGIVKISSDTSYF